MASVADDSIKPRDVCIVGVARTPMGSFLGSLSSLPATKLGSIAIECALKRAGVDPSSVQEVFFGNVLSANLGQAPARQAALGAGVPNSVICTTINKVCASGMKATMIAAQTINLGVNDVVVSGGMESMSNAPKYIATGRTGSRLGHDTIIDGMLKDGLWDVYNDFGMGVCAELCADQYNITREQQDSYAIQSFERGRAAESCGAFSWEIVPVEVSGGRGKPSTAVDKDEGLRKFDASKFKKLRPSFKKNGGSVTAGNASSMSDGAAALILVSGEFAAKHGLKIIARIRGYADAAQAPELFTTAPAIAIPKAISNSGLKAANIDVYEINEAFSVVALANQRLLNIDPVNPDGLECQRIYHDLPGSVVSELLWAWESLSDATCCRSLVVVYEGICILQIGFANVSNSNGGEPMVVDANKLVKGSLYSGVAKSGSQSYLAYLALYPGKSELPFLPSNTQAVILQPLGDNGIAIVGGDTIRGFTTSDQALRERNGKYGVAGIWNGGGGASAVVLDLVNERRRTRVARSML